jgi:hypothetical protein
VEGEYGIAGVNIAAQCQSPIDIRGDMFKGGQSVKEAPLYTSDSGWDSMNDPERPDSGVSLSGDTVINSPQEDKINPHCGGHTYRDVWSKDGGAQINGDIDILKSELQHGHTYSRVIACGTSRQINGNIGADTFLSFMRD